MAVEETAASEPTGAMGPDLGGAHWAPERLGAPMDRFLGLLIDGLILLPVRAVGLWLRDVRIEEHISEASVASQRIVMDDLSAWGDLLLVLPAFLYIVGTIGFRGATVGQRVMGLVVVQRATGGAVGWSRSLVRWSVVSLPGLLAVVLIEQRSFSLLPGIYGLVVLGWLFVDRDRQGLHDKAAGVVVIRDPARQRAATVRLADLPPPPAPRA